VAYEIDEFQLDPGAIRDDLCVSARVGAFGSNPVDCRGEHAVPLLRPRTGAFQTPLPARKGILRNFRRML
jgi:hypothetical protein